MYILKVSRGYPTEKYKMYGIFEFDQAKALADLGHKVIYAAVDIRSVRHWRKWGIEKKSLYGVTVYVINIPCGRLPKAISERVSIYGFRKLFSKIVKEQGVPDVIHAHFAFLGYTAAKVVGELDIPLVITEHLSIMMKKNIDSHLFDIAGHAYDKADAIIAVSPQLQDEIKRKFNKNAVYIPNIVQTDIFKYSPQKRESNEFRMVSVGGLIPRKRMDLTIRAFIQAFKDKDASLVIFGEGPERQKLEKIVQESDMESKVRLMGAASRNEIAQYMKESDCFVLESQAETFGVVYIEALASGLPVIATKCGGPESFVTSENGILVEVDDFNSLVSAMEYMNENPYKYDRLDISRKITGEFAPEVIGEKLLDVYRSVTHIHGS